MLIAVVGQACVLPGALTPAALWRLAVEGRSAIGRVPDGRWGIDRALMLATAGPDSRDRAASDHGGYVDGFDGVFDAHGFALPPDEIAALDPLFRWLLHVGRQALEDARHAGDGARVGAVVGNLSYPSSSLSRYAERVWLAAQPEGRRGGARADGAAPGDARRDGGALADRLGLPAIDARNRFMSGLPAHVLARGLGLGAGAFALDAACASSLYAIKLACDALADGRADLMLAGAVNRADDLFIHAGFTALGALSPSGRSRPFHAQADGLVPAEGAAMVALRRLDDALRDGDRILGVIRGVGLSNDGRGRGFLVPSEEGQVRALAAAYRAAQVAPADVSLCECHATGTLVGDAVEVRTLARVFAGRAEPLPIGSLKANLGHLITVAGAAGLLKLLGALREGIRPPTPGVEASTTVTGDAPVRVLEAAEPWNAPGPRRAAISAFGFGGNNAHLILEEAPAPARAPTASRAALGAAKIPAPVPAPVPTPGPAVAVVAVGARVGAGTCAADFAESLFTGANPGGRRAREVVLSLRGLRFPPKDLEETLPQQLSMFAAAREAVDGVAGLPAESTGVFVGMQCDAEIARHGARWRAAGWARALDAPAGWLGAARDGFVPLLGAAGVVGAMPNIPANRLSSQLDLGGPSFTVSAEELSGVRALELARRALARGEIDAAVVGAVDLSVEAVHEAAAAAVLPADRRVAGDAAVALVLKRLDDARRDGERVLAVLRDEPAGPASLRLGDEAGAVALSPLFGHAHAASGLLHVAAAALACAHRTLPRVKDAGVVRPWRCDGRRAARVHVEALGGQAATVYVEEAPPDARDGHADRHGADRDRHGHADRDRHGHADRDRHGDGRGDRDIDDEGRDLLATLRASARRPEAPLLSFPAHRPPPRLPPLAAPAEAVEAPAPQIMAPAPWLPPIGNHVAWRDTPGGASPSFAVASASTAAALDGDAPTSPVAAAPPALTGPLASIVARHTAQRAQIAAAHQDFLAQQAALHRQFLDGRQRAAALLLGHGPVAAAPPAWQAPPSVAPAVVPPLAPAVVPPPRVPTTFSRRDLETHASGRISQIFGPLFAAQDQHALQVRMPEPPLLLADRVVDLRAEAGSMGLGTVCTETDVRPDSWYLDDGAMPAGIMIESGQADLFLISYLGIDQHNQGRRVYRLLGCELTYHGRLPRVGDTLHYEIHVDSHARQGDLRLFFFHYDCTIGERAALTVRQGQAGFFSRQELDESAGVLWRPEDQDIRADARVDPPAVACTRRSLSAAQVRAFAAGDSFGCFGPGFELGQTHVRSPAIQGGRMQLVDHVEAWDPRGGPWGRGYLKAVTPIHADDWFFAGHFKNDPCMPGTLMFEGCLQAMAIYLAGCGATLSRDGWRFEPVPDVPYKLQCRGQVLPTSKELVCELFVEELHDGPIPTLYADLLGTVDGLKAFHARRVGLQLVPDWPLTSPARQQALEGSPSGPPVHGAPPRSPTSRPGLHAPASSPAGGPDLPPAAPAPDAGAVAEIDGFRFDYASLLACAWGKPSDAFGPMYRVFDGTRRVARLPGPPYHFMSRVSRIDGAIGVARPGATIEIAYDVPADAWYFAENGHPTMPFCVLLEAALQPCGWLASFVGSALLSDEDLSFRNLDGTGRVLAEIPPGAGTLRTVTTIKTLSRSGSMILESFTVRCSVGDVPVYEIETGFGFFPKAALENQVGLPTTAAERARLEAPSDFLVDLTAARAGTTGGAGATLRLAGPMLLMIDRVTACEARGGRAGLGFLRAEKDVDPAEWFFKAHFFQDPVQPGSLGIEAMLQLLQFHMLHSGLGEGLRRPRFEPIALGRPMTWKYRGQVVPGNRLISTTLEVTESGRDARGPYAVAEASLWVDGKRIYQAQGLGMRIVEGDAGAAPGGDGRDVAPTPGPPARPSPASPASAPASAAAATTGEPPAAAATSEMPAAATTSETPAAATATSETPAVFLPRVRGFWREWFGAAAPPVEDLYRALIDKFVRRLDVEDADALRAARGRGALFVGNHQTVVESTIFAIVASALMGAPVLTLAKVENREHWLELVMQHTFAHPGLRNPRMAKHFDRRDSASLPGIIEEMAEEMAASGRSVMVHVEGTRAISCRRPVETMSGAFIEMALAVGCPVVPVRFVGGLPAEPLAQRTEFPVGLGQQDYVVGRPIGPEALRPLNYRERRERVMAAINALPPPAAVEEPLPPDAAFERAVRATMTEIGASFGHATILAALGRLPDPSPATRELLRAARAGTTPAASTPEGRWLAALARRLAS